MAKRIFWTAQAKADMRAIEQPIAMQILKTLARYAQTGEGNTTMATSHSEPRRLRSVRPATCSSA
jgi:hypothetical protein